MTPIGRSLPDPAANTSPKFRARPLRRRLRSRTTSESFPRRDEQRFEHSRDDGRIKHAASEEVNTGVLAVGAGDPGVAAVERTLHYDLLARALCPCGVAWDDAVGVDGASRVAGQGIAVLVRRQDVECEGA